MRKSGALLTVIFLLAATVAKGALVKSVRIVKTPPDTRTGAVVVRANGTEAAIAQDAWNAWLLQGGRMIAYSKSDGAGGYENEGQSLRIYDVNTGKHRKVMAEVFAVQKVTEARSRSGKLALLVSMADGGIGAPHVAVVDPARGEVWRQTIARFVGVRNGQIAVAIYNADDIEDFGASTAKPTAIRYYDLDSLLKRPASATGPVR